MAAGGPARQNHTRDREYGRLEHPHRNWLRIGYPPLPHAPSGRNPHRPLFSFSHQTAPPAQMGTNTLEGETAGDIAVHSEMVHRYAVAQDNQQATRGNFSPPIPEMKKGAGACPLSQSWSPEP